MTSDLDKFVNALNYQYGAEIYVIEVPNQSKSQVEISCRNKNCCFDVKFSYTKNWGGNSHYELTYKFERHNLTAHPELDQNLI